MTLKERLLSKKPPSQSLTVDGECFTVVGLNRAELADVLAELRDAEGKIDSNALEKTLLTKCVCDEQGNRVFSDEESNEWDKLPASITSPTSALVQTVMRLNGVIQDPKDTAAKN